MNYYRVWVKDYDRVDYFKYSGMLEEGATVVVNYHDRRKMKSLTNYAADISKSPGSVVEQVSVEDVNKAGFNPKFLMRIDGPITETK